MRGLVAALLLGLAACGSADAGQGAAPSSATASTRQVDTVNGPVTVPADPLRIVSIQPSATATLYDVGVSPVGVYDQGSEYISPRYLTDWDAATKIGTNGQIDLEKVAALEPDLIIGLDYEWNTKVYSQLSALAPTVIAPTTTWQSTAQTVAEAVGRADELTTLQHQLADRSAQIKQTYAGQLAAHTWDILQGGFDQGQFWLYGPNSEVGTILAGAGVQFATGSAQISDPGPKTLSYEQIDTLSDADVIGFYANFDGTPNNEGPALFAQTGFAALPAVQAGRTVPFPDFLPGGYGDALAVLDELQGGLAKL